MADSKNMSTATFQLAYDGPGMAAHSMDVQELGPALMAVGDLCREASRVINGDLVDRVSVRVQANFEEHCFDITFHLIEFYKTITSLLETPEAASAKNLLEWIGFVGGAPAAGSLVAFLRWKKGRKIETVEQQAGPSGAIVYQITVEGDGNHFDLSAPSYQLYRSPRVMMAHRAVLAPLQQEGIDRFQVREGRKVISEITKADFEAGSFELPDDEAAEETSEEPQFFKAVLIIRAPVFVEGAKWQFFLGDDRITAVIADDDFNRRVFRDGERFGVNDRLVVKLKLTQVLSGAGRYRNDYEIVEVQKVVRGPEQLGLLGRP